MYACFLQFLLRTIYQWNYFHCLSRLICIFPCGKCWRRIQHIANEFWSHWNLYLRKKWLQCVLPCWWWSFVKHSIIILFNCASLFDCKGPKHFHPTVGDWQGFQLLRPVTSDFHWPLNHKWPGESPGINP